MGDEPAPQAGRDRALTWVALASAVVGALELIAELVVLRVLAPDQVGVAASAVALFPVLDISTDLGLSAAVVQGDAPDQATLSTAFWLNLGMALLVLGVVAILGAGLGAWQGHAIIGLLLLGYGGKGVLQNAYFLPAAMMRRHLRFRELSLVRIAAGAAALVGKIGAALAGFGVWCFLLGPLCRLAVLAAGVQWYQPWRPSLIFKRQQAADLLRFGLRSSLANLLLQLYSNLDYQVVLRVFGPEANALYYAAYRLVVEPVRVISGITQEVAFPLVARLRADLAAVRSELLLLTRRNLLLCVPVLSLVVVGADDIFAVLGPRYAGAAGTARILAVVGLLRATGLVLPPVLDGLGRPDATLRYTVVASLVVPAGFVASAGLLGSALGYRSVAVAWAVAYPVALAVLLATAGALLTFPVLAYLRAVAVAPACGAGAVAVGLGARALVTDAPPLARLAVGTLAGGLVLGMLLSRYAGLALGAAWRSLRA